MYFPDMKFHPVQIIALLASSLLFSCSGDSSHHVGTYRGNLVMEEGSKQVTLELRSDGTARLKGLHAKSPEGTWKAEATSLGFSADGVVATFDAKRGNDKFRVVLMLQKAEEGLILADLRGRLLLDKPTMLQSLELKKKKPLLRKYN